MTVSRRASRSAGRTAKPDSLRAAHEQITRNSGTLADIADLIEMEGRTVPGRQQPARSVRSQPEAGSPTGPSGTKVVEEGRRGHFLAQPLFGIPLLALLVCALILGAAVGVPLGVATYGTELYTVVVDGLAIL
jgi:hypothetical protein